MGFQHSSQNFGPNSKLYVNDYRLLNGTPVINQKTDTQNLPTTISSLKYNKILSYFVTIVLRRTPLPLQCLSSPLKRVWKFSNNLLVYTKAYTLFQKSFLQQRIKKFVYSYPKPPLENALNFTPTGNPIFHKECCWKLKSAPNGPEVILISLWFWDWSTNCWSLFYSLFNRLEQKVSWVLFLHGFWPTHTDLTANMMTLSFGGQGLLQNSHTWFLKLEPSEEFTPIKKSLWANLW